MSEATKEKKIYELHIDNFLSTNKVDVVLTYGFAPEPITFPSRLMLNTEEQAARQTFYALPDDAKENGRHKFHVELLASVLTDPPTGLPGFDAMAADPDNADADFRDLVRSYLMRGGHVAETIAGDWNESYHRAVRPAEFFR